MKPGPGPKPPQLRVVRGKAGSKQRLSGPLITGGMPEAPGFLGVEAAAEWQRVAGMLYVAGILTAADRAILAGYCAAWARFVQAETALATLPMTVETKNGYETPHPLLAVSHRALLTMARLAAEMGMTPSSRGRIVAVPPALEHDPSAKYFD